MLIARKIKRTVWVLLNGHYFGKLETPIWQSILVNSEVIQVILAFSEPDFQVIYEATLFCLANINNDSFLNRSI